MKKIFSIYLLLVLISRVSAVPLQTSNKHSIIIDTDCAIDDFRTIGMLLSRPEITIQAILVSDGSLPPEEGIRKVKSLLHEFNRDSIPVACGDILKDVNPPWSEFNKKIPWGSETGSRMTALKALDCLIDELNTTKERIILVCLGPLTTIGQLLKKDASLSSKIERIIWYNESVKPLHGFNYECDTLSALSVIASGIRIDVISNLKKEEAIFDTSLYADCEHSKTQLAAILYTIFKQKAVFEKLQENHFRLCDDLTALYFTNPELFDINVLRNTENVRYNQDYNVSAVREAYTDMITGAYVSERNIVFNRFPCEREMFQYDVRQIMDSAIARYGNEEWKATVMTDEFHGHLGVFSIVGAKMGIKARELFGVGPDMLDVTSYAGSRPPYSCLNDGIQVSTGATLGLGLIHLAADSITRPMAVFTYKNRSIRMSLKKEYLEQVKADINEGIVKFGMADDGFWKLIRRNALKYWLEWDRNEIFDIEVLN
jgi:inosine-uridine nucleoside N-ribohydrolase/formylmethanofuran dehydrogenase subunit E